MGRITAKDVAELIELERKPSLEGADLERWSALDDMRSTSGLLRVIAERDEAEAALLRARERDRIINAAPTNCHRCDDLGCDFCSPGVGGV